MNNRVLLYISGLFTFILFIILRYTYDTSTIVSFDQNMELLLKGNKFFSFFHYFGETSLIDFIAIILLFILWLKFKNYRGMFFVILTIPIGRLINHFVKEWVARPRPEIADQMASYSFPSGHAMMGLLYLFTIAYLLSELTKNHKSKLWYWIGALVLAILTGLSRVAEKHHFATDVIAGWSLGFTWFCICIFLYESIKR